MSLCMDCRHWHQLPGVENYEQGSGECFLHEEAPRRRHRLSNTCPSFVSERERLCCNDAMAGRVVRSMSDTTESVRLQRIVEAVRNLREARRNLMQAMVAGDDSPHDHACVGKALEALFALVDDEP